MNTKASMARELWMCKFEKKYKTEIDELVEAILDIFVENASNEVFRDIFVYCTRIPENDAPAIAVTNKKVEIYNGSELPAVCRYLKERIDALGYLEAIPSKKMDYPRCLVVSKCFSGEVLFKVRILTNIESGCRWKASV